MPSSLWERVNYKTSVKHLENHYIYEYDLSKANISALLFNKKIDKDKYEHYLNMDKSQREKEIGLWIRNDNSIYKSIQDGIKYAKRQLVYKNNIEDFEILSVKNDAIFTIRKLSDTIFDPFVFNLKNVYSIYMQLQDLEIYYIDNPMNGLTNTTIDIKGINDDKIPLHMNGMLDVVCDTCFMIQRGNAYQVIQYLMDIYERYINRSLPVNYYRSFDFNSAFSIQTQTLNFITETVDDSMVGYLNIDRNLSILRDLLSIVSDIYHAQYKYM